MRMSPPIAKNGLARTILVVEDDPDLSAAMCELLEDAGHVALRAVDGAEGLALLGREAVSLVLLDLQMPDMDGAEFRRRQLEDVNLAEVPVVVCTAQRPPLPDGIDDLPVLYKPFDRHELMRAIRRNAMEPARHAEVSSSAERLLGEIAQVQQRMSRVASELSAVRDDLRARSATPDEASQGEPLPRDEAPPSKSGTRARAEPGRYAQVDVTATPRRKRG